MKTPEKSAPVSDSFVDVFRDYTPYRSSDADAPDSSPKIRPSEKRPFVVSLQPTTRRLEGWIGKGGRPIYRRRLYHAVGCSVFDGRCINQDDFHEIDCAECVKSTFEAFIKGCRHRELYIDPHGTIRCATCKDELGQSEDRDVVEEDDPPEEDDPREQGDPEGLLNIEYLGHYRSWNLNNRWNQAAAHKEVRS